MPDFAAIAQLLSQLPPDQFSVGNAASEQDVRQAEIALSVSFPPSYKWFLQNYGTVDIGLTEIYGLGTIRVDGVPNVLGATLSLRSLVKDFPMDFVVICDPGGEETFCLDTDQVDAENECPVVRWTYVPLEQQDFEMIAPTFASFLLATARETLEHPYVPRPVEPIKWVRREPPRPWWRRLAVSSLWKKCCRQRKDSR
jgi:hypothetical protein